MFKCCHCAKEFKYESERKRHEQSHTPQFKCNVCCKKFSFISALKRHEKQHQRTGRVQCTDCGGNFRDEALLKRHIQYAHKGTFTCEKCSATFSSEIALNSHIKMHKPKSERRFRCSHNGCMKSFNFSHHLKHHELNHTNGKQHFCSVCGKGFIQAHHLKTHLKSHEPENWLFCLVPDCKKKFSNEYALRRHLATHKNRADSGISSDSNSACDVFTLKKVVKDTVLCSCCGQLILRRQYVNHMFSCIDTRDNAKENLLLMDQKELKVKNHDNLLDKEEDNKDRDNQENDQTKKSISDTISHCKSVIGACIMSGDSEISNNCLCAQMSKTKDNENYDLILPNEIKPTLGVSSKAQNAEKLPEVILMNNNEVHNTCEGCDCCNKNKMNCLQLPLIRSSKSIEPQKPIDVMPEIEYGKDGTVKIKELFDVNIKRPDNVDMMIRNEDRNEMSNVKCVPYNSCKDVLGNCIVSGDGTIGEGCLCARMAMEDHTLSAQEIEEITPCPKWSNNTFVM